jgi:N-glycosidase YbiA
MDKITEFQGQYRFLSNFWPAIVQYEGQVYPSVEHAYQAAKTTSLVQRMDILRAFSPGEAKRLGRRVTIRPNWEHIKTEIMYQLVKTKFQEPILRSKLLATGNAELIEGNRWNDRFWGICKGTGQNHLGKILMQVRQELRS